MLFPLYKSVKTRLALQVSDLKSIQWFNNQYEGIIHAEPLVLVEFPDGLDINEISKTSSRSDCSVRIHVISKSISDTDEDISDTQVETHDALVLAVTTALNHHTPLSEVEGPLGSKLIHTQYKIVHEYKGWLVTMLTFTTKINL
jgi:hypothetical protein